MTPIAAVQLSTSLLVSLATAAVRALALGGAAGLGLAAFRVKTTSARLFTWTAVLYAALAMPLLERMLPPLPVPTPAFLQYGAEQSTAIEVKASQTIAVAPIDLNSTPRKQTALSAVSPAASTRFEWSTIRWNVVAAEIYLAMVFLLLARLFVGLAFGRRLRRSSQMIRETRITVRFASRAQASGLSFIPQAAESEFISVPVTMGVLRPVVLLPTTWRDWDDAKLDAVIAHEVSHVARRDTLTQRLSLLHCTIFWFSPLTWWLNRHLADLVEQASDEFALACGADRKAYAKTLLGFFEALQGGPRRVWWQGVSMASAGRAEQRVERILAWKGAVAMSLKKSVAVVVVALAVPVVYFTASAHPADRNADPQTSKSVEIAQDQTPPPLPSASHAARASKKSSNHSFYSYGNDEAQRFVIVSGKSDSLTMSGTQEDGERVEELRKKIQGDFIWFRHDGKPYIIRDQTTIDRAKAFWSPQEELGKKQEELGKQQEALGKQQEELGSKMEQIHVKVPDMTKEIEKLQTELKQLNSGATVEQIGQIQSEIGDLQSKIGDIQSQAGDQQSKLGDEMGVLGEKQGKLGEQQGELGRQQGELAQQASRQMKQLLDETIAKGTAQLEQ
jgi:beta-lactamase regulating signal transducer with metallopeptidase domain